MISLKNKKRKDCLFIFSENSQSKFIFKNNMNNITVKSLSGKSIVLNDLDPKLTIDEFRALIGNNPQLKLQSFRQTNEDDDSVVYSFRLVLKTPNSQTKPIEDNRHCKNGYLFFIFTKFFSNFFFLQRKHWKNWVLFLIQLYILYLD